VLEYGKKERTVIVCLGPQSEFFNEMTYTLEYPARKLRKKGITIYVEAIDELEVARLEATCKNIESLNLPRFKGIRYQCVSGKRGG
jgi:hypothetical protein